MFKEFECDALTVPSCPIHNSKKCGTDQAIVTALLLSVNQLVEHGFKSESLSSDVQRAIQIGAPHFAQAKQQVSLRRLLSDPPDGLDVPLAFIEPGVGVHAWLRQLTAGLVWKVVGEHGAGTRWDAARVWSPSFCSGSGIRSAEQAATELREKLEEDTALQQQLRWWCGWSATPRRYPEDLFSFRLSFLERSGEPLHRQVLFRYRFYNSLTWYVEIETTFTIKNMLRDVARTVASMANQENIGIKQP